MKRLDVLTLNESERWDSLVKGFKQHDVYYLSGYSKAFHLHGDGEPLLVFYQDDAVKAMQVVMKRDIAQSALFSDKIPRGVFFDTVTPYGYGGFLVEGEYNATSLHGINEEYSAYCKGNCIISEFIRFHPLLRNHGLMHRMYCILPMGETIAVNLFSSDIVWGNMTSKNRNMVRKARKNDVSICWGRSPELFAAFQRLYAITMNANDAAEYYYFDAPFYESLLNDLRYNAMIFYAQRHGLTIASAIVLFCNGQMHYHLSGTDPSHRNLAPSNLLLYEAACWGSENGFSSFHLGGGLGATEDSLFMFKKAFNTHSDNRFYVGKKIFDEEKYKFLMEHRGFNVSEESTEERFSGYFPKYRGS